MHQILAKKLDISARSGRMFHIRERKIERMSGMNSVDPDKTWIPEEFTLAYYLPSYQNLIRSRQIELNQLYALKFCESTIFLESWIELCLTQNRKRELLSESEIVQFINEEREHTGWFKRLLTISRPDRYSNSNCYWLLPRILPLVTSWIGRVPYFDVYWLFLGLYFEERFLTLNRLIQKNSNVDEYHRAVHSAHVLDEAAHVQGDKTALQKVLERSSPMKKLVNGLMIRLTMKAIFFNIRFGSSVWNYLENLQAEEKETIKKMRHELELFILTPEYESLILSKKWNPITSGLIARDPRMKLILEGLLG